MLNSRSTSAGLVAAVLFCASQAMGGIIWYTAETGNSSGWSHLYSVETASRAITDRGIIHGQRYITDLAADSNGVLYGVGWENGQANGTARLYTITPGSATDWADWEVQTVHSNAMERSVNAATMLGKDLYVASASGELQKLIYKADKDRWDVIKSGSMGCYASDGDLAFSSDGQTLYATVNGGSLGRVNFDAASANFGKVTLVGPSGYQSLYGLVTVDGQLYATTNGPGNYASSYLVRLDPATGRAFDASLLGESVWGAAVGAIVPEPMSMVMLAAGGAMLILRRRNRLAA